jgi:hypothetical protein
MSEIRRRENPIGKLSRELEGSGNEEVKTSSLQTPASRPVPLSDTRSSPPSWQHDPPGSSNSQQPARVYGLCWRVSYPLECSETVTTATQATLDARMGQLSIEPGAALRAGRITIKGCITSAHKTSFDFQSVPPKGRRTKSVALCSWCPR